MPRHGEYREEAGAQAPASLRRGPPALALDLRPHRSMGVRGFQVVLGVVACGLALPLLPLLGTAAGWGLLPYLLAALLALYWAVLRNFRDADLREELRLWPDLITVERFEPKGAIRRWHANPYWVTPHIYPRARPENYLTLKGNGREIELGAFLSPEERLEVRDRICAALNSLR